MNRQEREYSTSTCQVLDVIKNVRSETVTSLEDDELKKGKRKRLNRIIKIIDKINKNIEECYKNTGSCDGLALTIAKGNPKSKKIQSGEYIINQLIKSTKPTDSFGTSKSRYSIKYYPTPDENLFIEDTNHQPKIQEQRKIRLVGINVLKDMRANR